MANIVRNKQANKQKTLVTAEILDLYDKRRKLTKKKFEPEGSEKYREVINNIKECMKKAKENWIGERCSEMKENLRKKNSRRAFQLVKDLTTVKQGKATTVQDRSGKCLTEEREIITDEQNTTLCCIITRPMEIHQYWTVPKQTQKMATPSFEKKWRLQYNH